MQANEIRTVPEWETLSSKFDKLRAVDLPPVFTVNDLIALLGERSFALVNLFIVLPFLQPIPLPFLSIPFGLILAASGFGMALGRRIWLPKFLKNKVIPSETMKKIFEVSFKVFSKTKRVIKPRMRFIPSNPVLRRLSGILIFSSGLFLSIPIPIPATNLAPALVILSLSIGALEEDGLLTLAGYALFALAVSLLVAFPHFIISFFT